MARNRPAEPPAGSDAAGGAPSTNTLLTRSTLSTIADAPAVGGCQCWVGAAPPASQPAIASARPAAMTTTSARNDAALRLLKITRAPRLVLHLDAAQRTPARGGCRAPPRARTAASSGALARRADLPGSWVS